MRVQTCTFEDGQVVLPGRVADPDLGIGEIVLDEIGADLERARATQGLQCGDALCVHGLVVGTEHQVLHQLAILANAFDGQIAAGEDVPCQGLGGLAHAVEHGQAALLVEVQADAQADLVGACILLEGFHQREYGVAGVGGDMGENGG